MHTSTSSSPGLRQVTVFDRLISSCEEVIQWRRPVLSSFYLLCTNTAFWACVFYLDKFQQLVSLLAIAVVFSVVCVLSTTIVTAGGFVTNARESYRKWFGVSDDVSPDQRGSLVSEVIFKSIAIVVFTLESFLLPMFTFTFSLLYQRPASIMMITGSLVSLNYLQNGQQERACWTAYFTVLLMVFVPPWRYNRVTEQIMTALGSLYLGIYQWLRLRIFDPILRFSRRCFSILRYCVCGHWIPPLTAWINNICKRISACVQYYFLGPIWRSLCFLQRHFVYWAFGYWIPPLMEYLNEKRTRFLAYLYTNVVEPIVAMFNRIRQFCVYWFGGYWIPPLIAYCTEKKDQLILAFHRNIIDPIVRFFSDFKNNMKFILLGHWIPPFAEWFRRRVVDNVIRAIVRCYNVAEYILCGRWIPGFILYLRKKALEARIYVEDRSRRLKAYLLDCAVRTKEYCRQLIIRTANYVKTQWVVPFVNWMRVTRARLHRWLIDHVFKPAWEGIKYQWRRFKFYVKHHILYPALRRTVYYILRGLVYAWQHAFVPVFSVIRAYGARGKDFAWVHWVEPGMDWLVRHLPEKSPLVDDSDTELRDYLPSDEDAEEGGNESEDEAEGDPGHPHEPAAGTSGVQPSFQSGVIQLKQKVAKFLSPDVGTSSEEENEFSAGLNFPALENADSDDEEEKSMVPRKLSSTSSTTQRRRKRSTKRITSGATNPASKDPSINQTSSSPSDPKHQASGQSENVASTKKGLNVAQPSGRSAQMEVEPDFEMIDHNDVND